MIPIRYHRQVVAAGAGAVGEVEAEAAPVARREGMVRLVAKAAGWVVRAWMAVTVVEAEVAAQAAGPRMQLQRWS